MTLNNTRSRLGSVLLSGILLFSLSAPFTAQIPTGQTPADKKSAGQSPTDKTPKSPAPPNQADPGQHCKGADCQDQGQPKDKDKERDNGISVGMPKVFDNRTLTIMLESLSEALRGMQNQFVNQQSLAAAFNYLQGFQSKEVVSNLSVTAMPIPGLKQETINTTGNATASGTPLPDTTKVTTTSDRPTFTPQAPALDNMPAFSGFNPTYGENSSDLLSDQVNLTYQIFNIRMLLERSLSDRVLAGTGDAAKSRRQAVLGFNVTIDPPRTAENAVAVVKITLEAGNANDELSLVSLMPQEKTYNAAALSTKSNSFGGAAVVKMFQVGYSERRRGQVFYLYRDNDTVSYERMNSGVTNQRVFGWMFRPVLGRKSVSPGLRQLFAIVSLPKDDARDGKESIKLKATVETYWKKYDRETMTSFTEDEANRSSRFKYALSFDLTKPEIFSKHYVNKATYNNIEVKSTSEYQDKLKPQVDSVSWVPIGPKSALISVIGNNFFSGTQVTMGDKLYSSAADGLLIKSNQAIDITTSLDALASGPGAIIGRYGPGVPLIKDVTAATDGLKVGNVRLGPSLSGNRSLEIDLLPLSGPGLTLSNLPSDAAAGGRLMPIVTVNGNVVPMPYTMVENTVTDATALNPSYLTLHTLIPDSFISAGGAVVKVSWPFRSDRWSASGRVYDPTSTYRVLRLGDKRIVVMTNDPFGFRALPTAADPCWMLLTGDDTIKLQVPPHTAGSPPTCTTLTKGVTPLSNFAVEVTTDKTIPDKVVLVSPEKFPYLLDVPKAVAAVEPSAPKAIELKQFDSVWVDVPFDDPDQVKSAEANKIPLRARRNAPGQKPNPKAVQILITREITAEAGNVDLILLDKAGVAIGGARLHVAPCENCGRNGGNR